MFLLLLVLVLFAPGAINAGPNLRVMPPAELTAKSTIIARARVIDTEESDWGDFRQFATLEFVDVIEGDFTIRQVNVAARSLLAYTDDKYEKKEEYLVFLVHEAGFYRTVNFQFGQFRIENDLVRGWRDAENNVSDQPYYAVREEVERILTDLRAPASSEPPQNGLEETPPDTGEPVSTQQAPAPRKPNPKPQKIIRHRPPQS